MVEEHLTQDVYINSELFMSVLEVIKKAGEEGVIRQESNTDRLNYSESILSILDKSIDMREDGTTWIQYSPQLYVKAY